MKSILEMQSFGPWLSDLDKNWYMHSTNTVRYEQNGGCWDDGHVLREVPTNVLSLLLAFVVVVVRILEMLSFGPWLSDLDENWHMHSTPKVKKAIKFRML